MDIPEDSPYRIPSKKSQDPLLILNLDHWGLGFRAWGLGFREHFFENLGP